ncbi:hypothetical protein GCM10010468_62520 [Actinocorallia longicatena]|uniref:DUF742 domain-containing protein n=2 Tax=Actinocorallia longicatena TaxID=111803 RepID=A0ABP6QLD3_9ACTN
MGWGEDDLGPRLPGPRAVQKEQEPRRAPFTPPPSVPAADEEDHGAIVRPFVLTGGRTRPVDERLRVETMISALPAALSAPLTFERRRIVRLCQRPLSVAELAGRLGAPIGVTRVLVADLLAERFVTVHDHLGMDDGRLLSVLERIREGVRAL